MSRIKTRLFAPVVALLLFSAAQARAGNISWHYNWSPGALSVFADAGEAGGFVTLTNEPPAQAVGNSDIVVTNLRTVSNAKPTNPDTFTSAGAFALNLSITDDASGKVGTLSFGGKFGGSFSANNSAVTAKFTGEITSQLFLGGNTYTVTIGPYAPPGPPVATNAGSISAHVDVTAGNNVGGGGGGGGGGIGQTANNPEPSTLALSLFGLTTVGAGWWRKRRSA
jgi:hypothetical protein